VVDGGANHVALDYGTRVELRMRGRERIAMIPKEERTPVTMLDDRWFVGGFEFQWSAERGLRVFSGVSATREVFALWVGADHATAIFQKGTNRGARTPIVSGWSERLLPGLASELQWDDAFDGLGSGAIGADRRVAVAMQDGRFIVLSPDGELAPPGYRAARKSTHLVETKLPFAPYDVSVVPPGYALLARSDQSISLHVLGADGAERWSAPVSFTPTEPPIDGSDGRIYLVGNGFAAYENGKALWSSPASSAQYATAYADGTVALAAGAELRIVGRDGSIRQTFRTAQGEPITTPPAIADDGSVWVATASALYVAR
jgi:hypothetical protein